jgi:pre-mRNA cleavage complex 2 protein Pcf11
LHVTSGRVALVADIHQAEPSPSRHSQTPQQLPPAGAPMQEVDLSALNRDIESLITTARTEFANNPLDFAIQQRLKALLDLQGILQRQELPQEQLKLVRDQVSALAPTSRPASQLSSLPSGLPALLNTAGPPPSVSTPPSHAIPQATQPNLQGLLNSSTLAGLIKATAPRQQPTPPPAVANILSQVQSASTPQPASGTPVASENPLIASLRARGLLPSNTGTPPAAPGNANLPFINPGLVRYTPPVGTPQAASSTDITVNVHMSTPSIKM